MKGKLNKELDKKHDFCIHLSKNVIRSIKGKWTYAVQWLFCVFDARCHTQILSLPSYSWSFLKNELNDYHQRSSTSAFI